MPSDLPLVLHTMAADLIERSLDAMFTEQFPENGSFLLRTVRGRGYWYYQGYKPGLTHQAKRSSIYVGPAHDPAIRARVESFEAIKASRKATSQIVNALVSSGLPRPPIAMGRIIEALAKGGVFRVRGVLVGSAAYQTYPLLLGQRLDQTAAITNDVDIAQFRAISIAVDDEAEHLGDILQRVDPSFAPVPHVSGGTASTAWQNSAKFRIDVLVPNQGSDELTGHPVRLPALPGTAGEPLRFLDYLIHQPVRSVVLHGPGIAVNVPQPAKFAIHKLIISGRRPADATGQAKARKDVLQASELILALQAASQSDAVEEVLAEACLRGPAWRKGIRHGSARLPAPSRELLDKWMSRLPGQIIPH